MPPSPQSTYVAPEIVPLSSLVLDGDTADLSESDIRRFMRSEFTRETDVTVAVRSAGAYLGIYPNQSAPQTYSVSGQDPKVLLDAMWQVKAQFPELLDPVSGELPADQAIIPVWSLGDGSYMAPALLTGAVSGQDGFDLGHTGVGHGTYHVSANPDSLVSQEIRKLSRGHQFSALTSPDINRGLLYALLASSIGLGLVLLVLVVNFGGIVSMRLGRFGRDAAKLKTVRDSLESLALGLDDSRLNNVAMLGQRPTASAAESDQRIFEGALAVAWRLAADLASRPLSHRLSELYVADIEKLAALVSLLSIRDGDAQRRTQALLDAARGGAPHLKERALLQGVEPVAPHRHG